MNPQTQIQFFEGPAGLLEVAIDFPAHAGARAGAVAGVSAGLGTGLSAGLSAGVGVVAGAGTGFGLIAHPHPLHGGNHNNKVVQTIARALRELGLQTWRPNFRGVGRSEGAYDEGNGEADDLLALLEMAAKILPGMGTPARPLVLAGFSFGSFVAAKVARVLSDRGNPAAQLILVGPAAARFPMPEVAEDALVIHGEADEVVALSEVLAWARPQALPVLVFPDTSHFFHGRLGLLKQRIKQSLGPLGLTAAAATAATAGAAGAADAAATAAS